jgi:hypothetical protein
VKINAGGISLQVVLSISLKGSPTKLVIPIIPQWFIWWFENISQGITNEVGNPDNPSMVHLVVLSISLKGSPTKLVIPIIPQ